MDDPAPHEDNLAEQRKARFALDEDTIKTGRAHIAKLRRQRAARLPPIADNAAPILNHNDDPDALDAARMTAQMATGAERDRLVQRVNQLETENRQLRHALAAVQHAVADAFAHDDRLNTSTDQT